MDPLFRRAELPVVQPGSLAPLAQGASDALRAAKQNVTVFESTTAGLVQAALQSCSGASGYVTCGAVTYHPKRAAVLLGFDASTVPKPADGAAYKESKNAFTQRVARRMRREVGATWCISESGACGPTFNFPDIDKGFCSIFVSGPVEKGIFIESPHNDREANMWGFTKLALDLLAECVAEAAGLADVSEPPSMSVTEDRYGGVEVEVSDAVLAVAGPAAFDRELKQGLEAWQAAGKKGIWLKVPLSCSSLIGVAAANGFSFHHAKPDYALLTRWLPETPSPLPMYGFTQIGVGGVVVNSKDEVLMVQERVSPLPMFQGSWKLPGGLADAGEDFADTVMREVREETGVTGSLMGVVSLRHSHGFRFGQGDIYVLVKLRAENEDITMDPHELMGAQWMSREVLESLTVAQGEPLDGKVSANNWKMINNALTGSLVVGTEMPNSRGGRPTMLYTAASQQAAM